jgi:alpha-glucosidase
LPLSADADLRNVASQRGDPASLYNLYRRLLALRRASAALTRGSYRPFTVTDELFCYLREAGDERVMVALNFSAKPAMVSLPDEKGTVLLATHGDREAETVTGSFMLPAQTGLVVSLDRPNRN